MLDRFCLSIVHDYRPNCTPLSPITITEQGKPFIARNDYRLNWTPLSPITITELGKPFITRNDYRLNWTPLSPITITELQSQTITLDSGFLFPHTSCLMLFSRFKKISKEKSTSL